MFAGGVFANVSGEIMFSPPVFSLSTGVVNAFLSRSILQLVGFPMVTDQVIDDDLAACVNDLFCCVQSMVLGMQAVQNCPPVWMLW